MDNINIYKEKLRESGLRPTRQRLKICEVLFSPEKTFHFTINDLTKIIEEKLNEKISLATVYNTIHAFKKKGYLKEISINSDKSYFDTNTKTHHHFFDNSTKELTDISDDQVEKVKINTSLPGKKITSVEVLVRVENN
jgi:Fur family iron response transcriptional regulator